MGEQAVTARDARIWFWVIFALAIALRIWTFRPYAIHHPDELYQYLEQAHRITFGSGIVPWEYRFGMRSWLPALLLSLPMRLGELISPGSLLPIILARASAAAIALATIPAAYALGSRLSRMHGLVAAAALAVWYESIYYSGHVLTEVLAVACFLPAAALIKAGASKRALAIGGALLALATLFRFHYAPAFAVFAIVTLGTRWKDWTPLIAGGVAVLLLAGISDAAMGQMPFGWIIANINENVVKGGAERFGVFSPLSYFLMMWLRWGLATPLLLTLPVLMMRRYPGLFWAALANVLVHMMIGHKEYRFVWLTTQIFVLLSAIASADLLCKAFERWKLGRKARNLGALLLIGCWAGGSAALAATDTLWPNWNRFGARMEAMAAAGRQPGLCGVAVGGDVDYWTGSHAYLRRSVPIYLPWRRNPDAAFQMLTAKAPAYNVIVVRQDASTRIPAGYRMVTCADDGDERICVYRRPGGCNASGADAELLQNMIVKYGF